jgi:hypothetical protein
MWQSNVPFPCFSVGFATWLRIFVTTGAPNVMFGTKWPSMISTAEDLRLSYYFFGTYLGVMEEI